MNRGGTSSMFILMTVLTTGLINLACPIHKDKPRLIGPEVKANQVIYFKHGVTNDQIETFLREVLSVPHPEGRGHYLRKGISEYSRIYPPVQGHEGIAVSFFPDATNEERDQVKRDISTSPIVYRILENVAPADVKTLDVTTPTGSKQK